MKYENITQTLLKRVPSFKEARERDLSYMSHDNDSPYLVFGDFGLFLHEYLKTTSRQTQDTNFLQQSFELLNEMLLSPDLEVVNLAQAGVLEILVDSPESAAAVRRYLTTDAIAICDKWCKKSGNSWMG